MIWSSKDKRKMQNVSFDNVNDFLEFLPDDEYQITVKLREIVFDSIPNVIEHLSFNVPYYKVNRNICFIWPASILWGKSQTYNGVRLGFTNGYLIHDETNYLSRENRKQVYWHDYMSFHELDVDIIKSYIFEAVIIDNQFRKKK